MYLVIDVLWAKSQLLDWQSIIQCPGRFAPEIFLNWYNKLNFVCVRACVCVCCASVCVCMCACMCVCCASVCVLCICVCAVHLCVCVLCICVCVHVFSLLLVSWERSPVQISCTPVSLRSNEPLQYHICICTQLPWQWTASAGPCKGSNMATEACVNWHKTLTPH